MFPTGRMDKLHDPEFGRGEYEIENPGSDTPERVEEFTKRLRAHFASPGYTPPLLPAVALEIHQIAQHPEVEIARVVSVLEKDPMLAARVLKISQSAAYAPLGSILSLKDAVVRIGLRALREIVWEVALTMRVFRSAQFGGPMETVRKHCIACAHASRQVASFTSIATDYAFLCGLLHDIGMAATLIVFGEQKDGKTPADETLLAAILRATHEEASRTVASLWKLPGDVGLVLGHHHAVMVDGYVHPLAAIVAVGEELATELGFGLTLAGDACERTDPTALARAREALQLDERRMGLLREQVKKLVPGGVIERATPTAAAPEPAKPLPQVRSAGRR
jgi:HD-like signal output (HDOD) protein